MSVIIAVLILGVIVLIHEFGHFLFAKLNKITVLEFSVGMGPRLISAQMGGTRYSVKVLPFGGSCMMLGEEEEGAGEGSFVSKSVWARISVLAAGPAFNFLLAFLLAMILIGATGYRCANVLGAEEGYPAWEAGIREGDRITAINGRSVHSYEDVTTYLFTHSGQSVSVTWKRMGENGKTETFKAQMEPLYSSETGAYRIGVQFDGKIYRADNLLTLAVQACYEVQYWIRYVFDSFYMIFHGLVTVDDISGPVGIVSAIDTATEEIAPYGIGAVLLMMINFTVLLSANLGVMNLLPLPALDGGRLLFLFIEAIRGKPVDREKEGMVHMAGLLLLFAVMALVLFNDVRKLF